MEVEEELDMLVAMYPDGDLRIAQKESCREISVNLSPRTGGQSSHAFVMAQIVMILEEGRYPDYPPQISIPSTKGLGDDELQLLDQAIHSCMEELWLLEGQPVPVSMGTVSIIEAASNCLDELNERARCQVCLSALLGEATHEPMRTACYHSFHIDCLAEWWVRAEASGKPQSAPLDFWTVRRGNIELALHAREAEVEQVRADLVDTEWRMAQAMQTLQDAAAEDGYSDPVERRNVSTELHQLQEKRRSLRQLQRVSAAKLFRVKQEAQDFEHAFARSREAEAAKPRTIPCPVCRLLLDLAELPTQLADTITAREARGASPEPESEHDAAAMKACLASLPVDVRAYVDRTQRGMRDVQEARALRLQQEEEDKEEDRTRAEDTTPTAEGAAEASSQPNTAAPTEGQLEERGSLPLPVPPASQREEGHRGKREGGGGRGRACQRQEGEHGSRGGGRQDGKKGEPAGGDLLQGNRGRGGGGGRGRQRHRRKDGGERTTKTDGPVRVDQEAVGRG